MVAYDAEPGGHVKNYPQIFQKGAEIFAQRDAKNAKIRNGGKEFCPQISQMDADFRRLSLPSSSLVTPMSPRLQPRKPWLQMEARNCSSPSNAEKQRLATKRRGRSWSFKDNGIPKPELGNEKTKNFLVLQDGYKYKRLHNRK